MFSSEYITCRILGRGAGRLDNPVKEKELLNVPYPQMTALKP